jgi:biopolymer transport protein ExbB/TolQ
MTSSAEYKFDRNTHLGEAALNTILGLVSAGVALTAESALVALASKAHW